ncbi:MAG: hypothetical protein WBA59_03690 [Moheibacter sp.]
MTRAEIIERLQSQKLEVTKLGIEHLQSILPIELGRMGFELNPFLKLEEAFDKQISRLQNRVSVEKTNQVTEQMNTVFKNLDPLNLKK